MSRVRVYGSSAYGPRARIDRDPELSEEEDFERNVRPLIPDDDWFAEKLFYWDMDDDPRMENPELAGWWVIHKDFHTELERELRDDELEESFPEEEFR